MSTWLTLYWDHVWRYWMLKRSLIAFVVVLLFFPAIVESNAADRFNMSYIYFGNTNAYYQHVESTQNTLDEISPNYFNLKDDGSLDLTLAVDTRFIQQMHDKKIKVVPFLSNHWDRAKGIKALENREQLAQQLADAVVWYNLDGVNVDIENVTEAERDMYTHFVKLLRDKLPQGKTLAVAVAPNPYKLTKGWQGSYDYAGLAEHSDYLMIMAYDESYTGGPAGPVASYSFVEATIRQALTLVPKEKLVLGIPFYGRYWKNGAAKGGYGLSNTDVVRLVSNYNGKVYFDTVKKSPYAVITINPWDNKPYVLGTPLEAGTYTIWFENETSIKYKLELVNKYDLKGTGSWSLGQETSDTWNYYGMWLNGYYYNDIQGHWAQGSILSMIDKTWMTGISSNRFAPENVLTRAEAAVILVRALKLQPTTERGAANFTDISKHWAKDEIETAAMHGIVQGTGNGKFSPDMCLTRQEMAVMLDRLLDVSDTGSLRNPYTDINRDMNPWSYDAIVRMTRLQIFTGNPDGTFGAAKYTTRSQMAVLMDRVAPLVDQSIPVLASK